MDSSHTNASPMRLVFALFTAAVLWFVMFSAWTAPHLNFWWAMTASALVLTTLALTSPEWRRPAVRLPHDALLGVLIAAALWVAFWVGDKLSQWLFDFARPQVDLIYSMKSGQPSWLLGLLLLFIIGPAEELFWRGYVQRTLACRWSPNAAFVVTTLVYALVHLPSMNFMLIMAALVCGIAWGGLYRLFPERLAAIILSHALWDAAAFVWLPL